MAMLKPSESVLRDGLVKDALRDAEYAKSVGALTDSGIAYGQAIWLRDKATARDVRRLARVQRMLRSL